MVKTELSVTKDDQVDQGGLVSKVMLVPMAEMDEEGDQARKESLHLEILE